MLEYDEINQRFENLKNKIADIVSKEVRIIAITKTFPKEIYSICSRLGLNHIGENKLQELKQKTNEITDFNLMDTFKIHFVGHLQTNKIKLLSRHVSNFDTLSSKHQLNEIEKFWSKNDLRPIPVLIQTNSTGEPSKSGIPINREEELFRVAQCCEDSKYVDLEGLMTIGPTPKPSAEPYLLEKTRQCFYQTRRLKECIEQELGRSLPRLSMGMSHDFEMALKEGSNEIRIGYSLFGKRHETNSF